mmetsp:Transcript_25302/g.99923  ORF Transcript_25302/g.99923 Transcript_25302/m.99923 type:complete len:151 (+) Transcript_25302:1544-1996(+)
MGKTEVENLILVVEGDIGKAKSIPPDSLRKELARVVAQDGFLVYQTPNLQETMKLYQNMHKWARKRYSKRTFKQLVYQKETIQEWNERMKRIQAPCMEDVFWQMMLQIPGSVSSLFTQSPGRAGEPFVLLTSYHRANYPLQASEERRSRK